MSATVAQGTGKNGPEAEPRKPRSKIARERVGAGRAGGRFIFVLGALTVVTFGALVLLARFPNDATEAERLVRADLSLPGLLYRALPLDGVRVLAAVASALTVVAVGVAARRLLQHEGAALLAAFLVALDPAFLAQGHLGVPGAFVLAGCVGGFACFLLPGQRWHWAGGGLLAIASAADPVSILWSVPLGLLLLTRGHIYAAPVHAMVAATQAVAIPVIPAVAVQLARFWWGTWEPACLQGSVLDGALLRRIQDLGGSVLLPDPGIWLAGIAAIVAPGALVLWHVGSQFKLARLPGRLNVRLPAPLPPFQARALWILALFVMAPHPMLVLPLGAIALGAVIVRLGDDAPAFGVAVGLALLAFAVLWLSKALIIVNASASADQIQQLMTAIPWGRVAGC